MPLSNITLIIRKIFDDYDEKNGAQQKTDYTQRANNIVQTWTQSMAKEGLTTQLICELHRLVCEDEWIPINDPKGGIAGFAKAGEYRTTPSSAASELKKDARRLFILPHDIALKMEQLVATMNNLLATKLPKDTMVENILAFLVELSTIHPFPNQNWRVILSLVELLAYQTKLEPFCISYINKVNPKLLIRSVEETILYQTVQPLLTIISRYKNEQHISIDDNEGIGSFFGYTKRQNPDEILHKTIHSLFPPLQTKRVLDAGCGSGTYTKYFIENGASVVGIDASHLAISRAKQTITGEVSFLLGNLEQPLSYLENESFDFIFSNLVIHYVLDWDRLFRDFFRILKFGGSAIIVVPHPNRNVVNDYFAVEKVSEVFYTETANINIEYYRRPFQMMLNPMTQAGFQIKNTIEFNQEANEQTSVLFLITKNATLTIAKNHMEQALGMAKQAFDAGDFPVGSVMVSNGEVVSKARNEIFTKNNYHHAEINLIAKSLSHQNVEHKVVYVTLEPCWRFAQALVDFGVKEVFYILEDPLGGGTDILKKSNVKMTKLSEYEKKYTELLLAYFTNNPHLPQQITQYKALYEHVKNNISKEKPDV